MGLRKPDPTNESQSFHAHIPIPGMCIHQNSSSEASSHKGAFSRMLNTYICAGISARPVRKLWHMSSRKKACLLLVLANSMVNMYSTPKNLGAQQTQDCRSLQAALFQTTKESVVCKQALEQHWLLASKIEFTTVQKLAYAITSQPAVPDEHSTSPRISSCIEDFPWDHENCLYDLLLYSRKTS